MHFWSACFMRFWWLLPYCLNIINIVCFFSFQTKIQLYCWVLHWRYLQLSMRDLYSSFMKCFCRRDTQTVLVMIITGTNCGIPCRLVLYWCGAWTDLVDPKCMELLIIAEIWLCKLLIYTDPVCNHHAVNMTGCLKATYLISAFCGDNGFILHLLHHLWFFHV